METSVNILVDIFLRFFSLAKKPQATNFVLTGEVKEKNTKKLMHLIVLFSLSLFLHSKSWSVMCT